MVDMDDPRNVFLSAGEVLARYGWGKTKGCQNLKDRELVPPPGHDASGSVATRSAAGVGGEADGAGRGGAGGACRAGSRGGEACRPAATSEATQFFNAAEPGRIALVA